MNTEIKIEVRITRTTKPWIGRVIGTHPQYGVEVEFLAGAAMSRSYSTYEITEAGIYKCPTGDKGETNVASRRNDTGFFSVADDGTVTEISKTDAIAAAAKINN